MSQIGTWYCSVCSSHLGDSVSVTLRPIVPHRTPALITGLATASPLKMQPVDGFCGWIIR